MARARPISLTKLEGEVMLAVWDLAGPVRVRDVADALNARRKDKGIVEQVEGPGRAHLYRALVSREQASRHMVRDLADRLFGGEVQPLLLRLIGQARLKPAELRELRDWVDAKLRDGKESRA